MISQSIIGRIGEQVINKYVLSNESGMHVTLINYGATITSIRLPTGDAFVEIACGFNTLEDYLADVYLANYPYFGATIGRVANRIKAGRLVIGEAYYELEKNDGSNHLHGGSRGFHTSVWQCELEGERLVMRLSRAHLEDGYPGKIDIHVTFALTNNNQLIISYKGIVDRPTPLSLTNHTYFNLSGFKEGIVDHSLQIPALAISEKDESNCPVGFTESISPNNNFNQQNELGSIELDDYYFFDRRDKNSPCASLTHAKSNRKLEIYSTEPGAQVYNAKYVSPLLRRSASEVYGPGCGICFETHDFPNLLGKDQSIITPEIPFSSETIYSFFW